MSLPARSLARTSVLAALGLFAALTPSAARAASTTDGHWVELGPPARQEHTTIYDAANDRLVLFGGHSNILSNAVWTLDFATLTWTQLEPGGPAPSPRDGHVAVYDPSRQRMVVFGGNDGAELNDVWALSLGATPQWTQLSPSGTPPSARAQLAGIYDPVRDRMLIQGGDSGGALDDVWALSFAGGGSWSQITTGGPTPPARSEHAGAYDPVRDRLLIYGGASGTPYVFFGDVWALDLATNVWSQIVGTGGPPTPRRQAAAVYDPGHDALVVIGGYEGPLPVADTWALSLGGTPTWVQKLSPSVYGHAATWVPALQGAVVTGGYNYATIHTVTSLVKPDTYSSADALVPGGPWRRSELDGIYDPVRDHLVIFGGDMANGFDPIPNADTWSMSAGNPPVWTMLSQFMPRERVLHTLVRDPADDRMILFGGYAWYGQDTNLNDTWSFDLATETWGELTFGGQVPGSHMNHTAILDPVGHRMIVFGGNVDGAPSNELWQLDLTGTPTWSLLAASGTPPAPRADQVAVYDPVGQRMLVFGGHSGFGYSFVSYDDLWQLSLDGPPAWTQLSPLGTPPSGPSYGPMYRAVYDPIRHRMIVLGSTGYQLVLTGTPRWAPLVTTGPAPAAGGLPVVYDPNGDRILVFAGNGSDATLALDLDPVGTVSVPAPANSVAFALRRVSPNPAHANLTVSFDLPRPGAASIELIDLAGRRLSAQSFEALAAGSHQRTIQIPGGAAPGVYFVRVGFAGRTLSAKVALIR
jgi:Galactose oxidase, central domain/Kelch motif